MKKILSSVLAAVLLFLNSFAIVSAEKAGNGILGEMVFLSDEIPDEATEYARNFFASLDGGSLIDAGFSENEIEYLRLEPGITAYEYDECDDPYYYFPVSNEKSITALLTVINLGNGKYSAQFGKCDFADSLNDIETSYDNPCLLVITTEGMYALNNKDEFVELDSYSYGQQESVLRITTTLPDITFEQAAATNEKVVVVSRNTVFDESINILSSYSVVLNKTLNVPYCANGKNDTYPNGYCWVSSISSIVSFRKPTMKSVEEIKQDFLDEFQKDKPKYSREFVKSILEREISSTFKDCSGYPSIYGTLNQSKPIYSYWNNNDDTSAHAMVVRGYNYNEALSLETISLMDPNRINYQTVTLGSGYKIGTKTMYWRSSVY